MIIGSNLLSELNIGLCLSNDTVRVNESLYNGFNNPMKDILKNKFNLSLNCLKYESFHNREIWERKNVLDTTLCTRFILYSLKNGLHKVVSERDKIIKSRALNDL